MSYPGAGKVDLEKWETASTSDTIHDAEVPTSSLPENQIIKDDEKDYGITRLTSRPELRAVVPSALRPTLSRTVSRITNRDVVDPGPAPDGGVKAWTQVACAWMICVTTWGYVNSFGVFQTYYTERLGETQSTVSWVGSIQLWVIFVMSAFSGRALDAGLFIPTLIVGSFIQLIGIFMTSLCHDFWQLLLAQGLCTGLGSGIIFCPAMGLVTTYFTRKRALAIAIVTTGNSFGGGVYPVVVRQLLPKIGFPWTVRILGFLNMAFLLAAIAFMRPRLPPRKSGPLIEWQAFKEFPYVALVTGFSFVFGALFFSYYFIGSYGRDVIGLTYQDSTNLVIMFNVIAIPIRLLSGFLVDKYTGPLNAMVVLLPVNGMLAFAWIGVRSKAGLYVFTCIYGMAAGAFQCLFPTTVSSLNKDMSKNGIRLGMAFSIFSFAGLTGPPIGGALLQTNGGGRGGYMSAQLGVGLATMLGACFVVAARVSREGWSVKKKC